MGRKTVKKRPRHKKKVRSKRGGVDRLVPSWMDPGLPRKPLQMSRRRNNTRRQNSRQSNRSNYSRGRAAPRRNNTRRQNSMGKQPGRSNSSWGRAAPRRNNPTPRRNSQQKSTGAYVPPWRRSNATQSQRMGAVPTNNKTIKTNNVIKQMVRFNSGDVFRSTPKSRRGQGGDSYIDYTNRLDAENIHNHSSQLEYPHHHLSSAHFKTQGMGKSNYPSFRGHVKLRTSRGDFVSLSVRISNDDVLMLYHNDNIRIFRLENLNANIRQQLRKAPRYKTLDIDNTSEDKLLEYIDKTIKRHYLIQKSIKHLV